MYRVSKFTETIIKERFNQIEKGQIHSMHMSKKELQILINNFMTLTNDLDDNVPIILNASIVDALKDAMNGLMDLGGCLSDGYSVQKDGIVQDGYGYIYAGTASKTYKVGQKLSIKENNDITNTVGADPLGHNPIIMLSRVNKKTPQLETYMYFCPDRFGRYQCTKISTNKDAELCQGFRHYIYHRLTNRVKVNAYSTYGFANNTAGMKKILNDYPMGTIIEMKDETYVKASPVGTSACIHIYNGAIDI